MLTGCQKKDAVENQTEIERLEESVSESAQDMADAFQEDMYDTDAPRTDTQDTDAFDIGAYDTEAWDADALDTGTYDTDAFQTDRSDTNTLEIGSPDTTPDEAGMVEGNHTMSNPADSFYYTALTEEIKARITGKSYPDTDEALQISYEDLAYVHVLHYDFQAQVQEGELICNQTIAQDLVDIFYELYESQYPIEKIRLIDEYDADDEASMADNNTSCFNYRTVPGRTTLSNHSYGCAIDINPLYNPYVRTSGGKELISPDNAVPYADRIADFPHKIDKNDLCYRIFIEHGFRWGGAWNSSKDYQHFEKVS